MTPIIEIESISKKYYISGRSASYNTLRDTISSLGTRVAKEEFWALRDITFSMNQGEIMGIIGRNGAGKTTLLKILAKITRPTSGKGRINGRVASLLEVGTGFHHELTGRENIYLNGIILGLKKKEIDKNFERIVEFAGIGEFLNTPLKHYSTGMWARLAFSVAAHLEPEILLIDEVLSVGDTEFQKRSLEKMNDLSKSGRTVIFVSHNMPAVRNLCKECIYLHEGRIKNKGNVNEVIEDYMSGYNQNTSGISELSQVKTRKGSQIVKLKKIELRDQSDQVTGSFLLKDDLSIHLFFEAYKLMRKVKVIVEIRDSAGETICNMYDTDSGFSLTNVEGNNHISLLIKDIRFCPGRYSISVSLISEILNYKLDYYDEIEYAISFDIENQIISDRSLNRRSGMLILTPEWQVHQS
jgi:lipopolysaccharide transport system ATP-binding protein